MVDTRELEAPIRVYRGFGDRFGMTSGFGQDTSWQISGIIHYRNGLSRFRPARGCDLSEKEKRFFTRLMGPVGAE